MKYRNKDEQINALEAEIEKLEAILSSDPEQTASLDVREHWRLASVRHCSQLEDLIWHIRLYADPEHTGYEEMTTLQKAMYDEIIERKKKLDGTGE